MGHLFSSALAISALFLSAAQAVTFQDAQGDQLQIAQSPRFDITGISVQTHNDSFALTFEFAAPATPSQLQELGGVIEFDTDGNVDTGIPSHLEDYALTPSIVIGVDYYLEVFPFSDEVWLSHIDSQGETASNSCTRSIAGNAVTIDIPRSYDPQAEGMIVGDGFHFLALLGNNFGPTDRAPNGETPYAVVVPEPASVSFLGLGLAALLPWTTRRPR